MDNTTQDQATQQECEGCNAEAGEECRPTCTGQAANVEVGHGSLADLFGGNIISVYTRADALRDGVLIAAPEALARVAGFVWPVALTSRAWADRVTWSEDPDSTTLRGAGQDETGRLWDVLWMARHAVRQAGPGADRLSFSLLRVPATGTDVTPQLVTLSLLAGLGDRGEPLLTIGEPGED